MNKLFVLKIKQGYQYHLIWSQINSEMLEQKPVIKTIGHYYLQEVCLTRCRSRLKATIDC